MRECIQFQLAGLSIVSINCLIDFWFFSSSSFSSLSSSSLSLLPFSLSPTACTHLCFYLLAKKFGFVYSDHCYIWWPSTISLSLYFALSTGVCVCVCVISTKRKKDIPLWYLPYPNISIHYNTHKYIVFNVIFVDDDVISWWPPQQQQHF